METMDLISKIESLPENIQKEIIDLINLIFNQYNIDNQSNVDNNELTESQKQELINRHKKMREKPETNMTLAEFKKQILEKYAGK
ncbi:MAG: hypothetical protein MUE85_00475 [Microscillaceae bacterium]|jgi:hypothetical protein|nr:hypothetical protein [Microscillaceae bacterium]